MRTKLEIYPDKKNCFKRELELLRKWKISQRNKEFLTQYQNYLFSRGSGDLRVTKLSSQIRRICLELGKDIDTATREDLIRIVSYYNRQDSYSEETKADYRRGIKQFYSWFKDIDTRLESENKDVLKEATQFYKYLEKEIKTTCKLRSLDYSNILKEEEIDTVIEKGCKTYKEKALIKFLHETGCRAGELLNMTIKDIEFKDTHALARLDGKTGERRVFIIHSLPLLTKYLEVHPYKHNENAFLWVGESNKYLNAPLIHKGAETLVARCFERAEFKHKKHNMHWFRHSRATLLAPSFSEVVLCDYMGWVRGSKQIKRYVHLCAKQVENAFMEVNGLIKKEDNQRLPKRCSCNTLNEFNARYCFRCGKPLSVEIAVQDEQNIKVETDKSINLLMEIMRNPEMLKAFEQFKANIK